MPVSALPVFVGVLGLILLPSALVPFFGMGSAALDALAEIVSSLPAFATLSSLDLALPVEDALFVALGFALVLFASVFLQGGVMSGSSSVSVRLRFWASGAVLPSVLP